MARVSKAARQLTSSFVGSTLLSSLSDEVVCSTSGAKSSSLASLSAWAAVGCEVDEIFFFPTRGLFEVEGLAFVNFLSLLPYSSCCKSVIAS